MLYDYERDFNNNGEFHGAIMVKWNVQNKIDPKFATDQFRAKVDFEADKKICKTQRCSIISPFPIVNNKDAYIWLVCVIVWILG